MMRINKTSNGIDKAKMGEGGVRTRLLSLCVCASRREWEREKKHHSPCLIGTFQCGARQKLPTDEQRPSSVNNLPTNILAALQIFNCRGKI
jgi:hypothetical protein